MAGLVGAIERKIKWSTFRSATSARWRSRNSIPPSCCKHAAQQAAERGYDKFPIVDVDSHHYELESLDQILDYMDDPVLQQLARSATQSGGSKGTGVLPGGVGYQDIGGRVLRYSVRKLEKVPAEPHRDVSLTRALDGRDGHRHRGDLSLADAAARAPSAGRDGGRVRARL